MKIILNIFVVIVITLVSAWVVGRQAHNPLAFTVDGKYFFKPESETFKKGCVSSINIMISSGSNESNAANVIINYNPSEIEIIDSNTSRSGIQIVPGTAYEAYADNVVDESTGKIRLTGFSIGSLFSGTGTFATINFRSKPGVEKTTFSIVFDGIGKTLDSNIAEVNTSDDVLSSVGSGSYTFTEGQCFEDTIGPSIEPIYPKNFDLNVPKDAILEVKICDSDSGVDIKTVTIDILGEIYTYVNTENFTYAGDPSCYNIKVKPKNEFPVNEAVLVVYKAKDFKGNGSQATVIFNIPGEASEIIMKIIEKEKEIEKCEENLTNCKEELKTYQVTGIPAIIQTLTGQKAERKDGKCPLFWLSLIAFLILFALSYFRNFINDKNLPKVLRTTLTVLFVIGLILAAAGVFRCYSPFSIATLILYLLVALYKVYKRFKQQNRQPSRQNFSQ